MKRTAEKVLSIISAVFTLLAIIGSFAFAAIMKAVLSDGTLRSEYGIGIFSRSNIRCRRC